MPQPGKRWSIIVAGGEEQRMQPFIPKWLGYPRPKLPQERTGHNNGPYSARHSMHTGQVWLYDMGYKLKGEAETG